MTNKDFSIALAYLLEAGESPADQRAAPTDREFKALYAVFLRVKRGLDAGGGSDITDYSGTA